MFSKEKLRTAAGMALVVHFDGLLPASERVYVTDPAATKKLRKFFGPDFGTLPGVHSPGSKRGLSSEMTGEVVGRDRMTSDQDWALRRGEGRL